MSALSHQVPDETQAFHFRRSRNRKGEDGEE